MSSIQIVAPAGGSCIVSQEYKYFVLRVDRDEAVEAKEKANLAAMSTNDFIESLLVTYSPLLLDQNLQHMFCRNVETGSREIQSRKPEVDFLFHPLLEGQPSNLVPEWLDEMLEEGGASRKSTRRGRRGGAGSSGVTRGNGYLDLRGIRRGGFYTGWDGKPRRACKTRLRQSAEALGLAREIVASREAGRAAFLVVRTLSIPYNSHLGHLGFSLQLRLPVDDEQVQVVSSDVFLLLHHAPRNKEGRYQHVDISAYGGPPRNAFQEPDPSLRCVTVPNESLLRLDMVSAVGGAVLDDGITPGAMVGAAEPILFRHSLRTVAQLRLAAEPSRLLDLRPVADRVPIRSPFDDEDSEGEELVTTGPRRDVGARVSRPRRRTGRSGESAGGVDEDDEEFVPESAGGGGGGGKQLGRSLGRRSSGLPAKRPRTSNVFASADQEPLSSLFNVLDSNTPLGQFALSLGGPYTSLNVLSGSVPPAPQLPQDSQPSQPHGMAVESLMSIARRESAVAAAAQAAQAPTTSSAPGVRLGRRRPPAESSASSPMLEAGAKRPRTSSISSQPWVAPGNDLGLSGSGPLGLGAPMPMGVPPESGASLSSVFQTNTPFRAPDEQRFQPHS